jgi:hypothetical protein
VRSSLHGTAGSFAHREGETRSVVCGCSGTVIAATLAKGEGLLMLLRILLICAAAAIAAFNAAYAQQTPAPAAAVEPDPANPSRNEESSVALTTPSTKDLVGIRVQTPSGEELGTVEQVLKDEVAGREFVMLKVGDIYTAMPVAALSLMMRGNVLVVDRAQLEGAPHVGTDWRRHVSNDAYMQSETYWKSQHEKMRPSAEKPPPNDRR